MAMRGLSAEDDYGFAGVKLSGRVALRTVCCPSLILAAARAELGTGIAARAKLGQEPRKGATMDEIKGIARVKFHPGKVEEWKRLTEQAMEIVRTRDTGTLQYEIFFNEDESEAVVFERYRDADAAIEHFSHISHLMEPIMATASVTGEVLGTPNAKMKEQLGKGGPRLFTPWMALQDQELAEQE
jgi:quinol monooxygenase YgiN